MVAEPRLQLEAWFHPISRVSWISLIAALHLAVWFAAIHLADPLASEHTFVVSPLGVGAEPEFAFSGGLHFCKASSACETWCGGDLSASGISAGGGVWASGGRWVGYRFFLASGWSRWFRDCLVGAMEPSSGQEPGMGSAGPNQPVDAEAAMRNEIDRIVRGRLDQALGSVFSRLITTTERAAQAAESQAVASKSNGLLKALRMPEWKPKDREEELRTWKEWHFQLCTWLIANDPEFEGDMEDITWDEEIDNSLLPDETASRSQRLFGALCSLVKGRPLLLIKGLEKEKNGYEALRRLRREMEPKERTRSLAIMRQLAQWEFKENVGLHEQLVAYEEALRAYESSSGKTFSEDLMVATVVMGLKEPLKSQVQLRMTPDTKYSDLREWILQYENVNTPWSLSLSTSSKSQAGGPQPMDVDQVWAKGWGKGGKKGKKGKDDKGKGKGKWAKGDGKQQQWSKGQQQAQWGRGKGTGGWQKGKGNYSSNSWWENNQHGGKSNNNGNPKSKGKGGGQSNVCHKCGQSGHWKNECPNKGRVNQVEDGGGGATSSGASSASTSATAYRTPSTVQQVQAMPLGTPPGCRAVEIFDISEVECESDLGEFSLDGAEVMMVSAVSTKESGKVMEFRMDSTDEDNEWVVWEPSVFDQNLLETEVEINMVQHYGRVQPGGTEVEVVMDSGADVSVAPLDFAGLGDPAGPLEVFMRDAQGHEIQQHAARYLNVEVQDDEGKWVTIREKFAIAKVNSLIISLGKLWRSGWRLSTGKKGPVLKQGERILPMRLRRNTLVMTALVSSIAMLDVSALPPQLEDVIETPGWSILPSGLPVLVAHRTKEIPFEQAVWSSDDWEWVAVFVRREEAVRGPRRGDTWVQVCAVTTYDFEHSPKVITNIESELAGFRDVCVLFHVAELNRDILTNPGTLFDEPKEFDEPYVPGDVGGGLGDEPMEVLGGERDLRGQVRHADLEDDELDGVELSMETPLKNLKDLCDKLGVSKSGPKARVLRRLRDHKEVLEKQLSTEVAKQMFREGERNPEQFRVPVLPSKEQQDLHALTHHPFQPWCEACVMSRSRQSPHEKQTEEKGDIVENEYKEPKPRIQIDYCYTFTKERGEVEPEEPEPQGEHQQPDEAQEAEDYRDQFALNLVGAESTSGWVVAIPLVAKGSSSLKKVSEALTRLSMQVAGATEVVLQGDPEPSIKQVLHAVEACRVKLGLRSAVQLAPAGSHASNGQAETAVSTIRRNAMTLKCFLEARIGARLSGKHPLFAWLLRHAAFLYNRFSTTSRGITPFEVLHGRRYRGRLLVFGESCIFHKATKYKGDLQWRKGIWVGVNEKNNAHVLLTPEGACESRSIRRVPVESQWSADEVFQVKGLPWDYGGKVRRKRAMYTSRVPLLPDHASLEQLARAAGKAAAESIAAGTPKPPADELGTDSSSSSSNPSSPSRSSRKSQGMEDIAEEKAPAAEEKAPTAEEEAPAAQEEASAAMDSSTKVTRPGPEKGPASKRVKLLLDRPKGSPTAGSVGGSLYPPGFAGISMVHGDVEMDEYSQAETWLDEVEPVLEFTENACEEMWWSPDDPPPELSPDELAALDLESDRTEVERLVAMGALRPPRDGEDLGQYEQLTTKVVRDWRKRPGWIRRSRLVAREFRSWTP